MEESESIDLDAEAEEYGYEEESGLDDDEWEEESESIDLDAEAEEYEEESGLDVIVKTWFFFITILFCFGI